MSRSRGFGPTWGTSRPTGGSGGQGGGIPEAPQDGGRYVRRNGQWELVPYATDAQTKQMSSEESVVTPKSLGSLVNDMGISKDEESGEWVNDQGTF